jgi:N-carbamoyl-L-amino-acid hydrolase
VILRDTDEAPMRALDGGMRARVAEVAVAHNLAHRISGMSWLAPVALDTSLAALLREEAGRLGLDALDMTSGAGHDAQTMQTLCPSALLFVPSRGGVSHAPQEFTQWSDIELGASLMLAVLVRLCRAA